MDNLPRHFGTDASLDPARRSELSAWLAANAGTCKRVREAPPEDRITRSAWFMRKHDEVPAATWKLPAVKSAANCSRLPHRRPNKEISMNTTSASPAEAPRRTGRAAAQGPGLGRAGARLPLADGAELRRRLPHRRERALAPAARDAGLHDGRAGGLSHPLGPGRHAPRALLELRARPGGGRRATCAALLRGRPEHHAGHNPAGALAIVALAGADAGGRGVGLGHLQRGRRRLAGGAARGRGQR